MGRAGTLEPTHCGNCNAALTGPYCAQCGQHAHESARSMHALLHDAWHLATHVDGRFWQTLQTLLLRPGVLTREYFLERRMRYLPPVRVYLVLSVLLFGFNVVTPEFHPAAPAKTATGSDAQAPAPAPAAEQGDDDDVGQAVRNAIGGLGSFDCEKLHSSFGWLTERFRESCRRNLQLNFQPFIEALVHTIPKMMFVFMPLLALCMLLLYWFPRRYYVEHLVFFLHNHAAMFLILLIEAFLGWLLHLAGWHTLHGWLIALAWCYAAWYVYRSMRVFYGQGFWLTVTKLVVMAFAYSVVFAITVPMALMFAAVNN